MLFYMYCRGLYNILFYHFSILFHFAGCPSKSWNIGIANGVRRYPARVIGNLPKSNTDTEQGE